MCQLRVFIILFATYFSCLHSPSPKLQANIEEDDAKDKQLSHATKIDSNLLGNTIRHIETTISSMLSDKHCNTSHNSFMPAQVAQLLGQMPSKLEVRGLNPRWPIIHVIHLSTSQ